MAEITKITQLRKEKSQLWSGERLNKKSWDPGTTENRLLDLTRFTTRDD